MKYAAAMKYGGELVDAADCDYSDFTALVPLCLECKEVVHLRKGGERLSAKGNSYKFGACWAHTKGRDAEHVAGCEMRVNGYSAEDKTKIAAKAKGQRLKLIQRWFWEVLTKQSAGAFLLNPENNYAMASEKTVKSFARWLCKDCIDTISNCIDTVNAPTTVQTIIMRKQHMIKSMWRQTPESDRPRVKNEDQHTAIVEEIVNFLLSAQQQKMMNKIMNGIEWLCVSEAMYNQNDDDSHVFFSSDATEDDEHRIRFRFMCRQLVLVPWAEEFQKLAAKQEQAMQQLSTPAKASAA